MPVGINMKNPSKPKDTRQRYIEAARNLYCLRSDDNIEVDDNAELSLSEDGDFAWVRAWVYVRKEDL